VSRAYVFDVLDSPRYNPVGVGVYVVWLLFGATLKCYLINCYFLSLFLCIVLLFDILSFRKNAEWGHSNRQMVVPFSLFYFLIVKYLYAGLTKIIILDEFGLARIKYQNLSKKKQKQKKVRRTFNLICQMDHFRTT
jgi:hypothetical protein